MEKTTKYHPKIGIGVIVLKDKRILLGKRKNSHGDGSWSFPGGHLELWESFSDCALREVKEETGLDIDIINENPMAATNDIFKAEKKEDKFIRGPLHYITLYMKAAHIRGEPTVKEPDKCDEWNWCQWGKFPQPLFLPVQNLLKQNYNPFE